MENTLENQREYIIKGQILNNFLSYMEAIILAGGFGKRLRSKIKDIPKPMAPINNKPFLFYIMENLLNYGFDHIIISIGYKGEVISDYFGDNYFGIDISYVKEEHPLGTGGAIKLALKKSKEDHLFIINGDTYFDIDFLKVERFWKLHNKPIIITTNVSDSSRYGALTVDKEFITSFQEKGYNLSSIINAGYYLFPVNLFDSFKLKKSFSLEEEFLKKYIEREKIMFFPADGLFIDIGIPEDYDLAQKLIN